ncbi:MAG: hypothetical protein GY909_14785 [Oligoflexia bacterium]|nr:hypothetical protein [Oligoflexia bacterium]
MSPFTQNIKKVQFIDMWNNYKHRFVVNEECNFPDYVLVNDELAMNEAISEGVPDNIIKVAGHPYFEKIIQKSHFDSTASSTVYYIDQPIENFYQNKLGFTEEDLINHLIELNLENIYYISHPSRSLVESFPQIPSDKVINASEVNLSPNKCSVLGFFSSLMIEYYLMGIPVASFNSRGSKNLLPLVRNGIIKELYDKEDILSFIKESQTERYLPPKNPFIGSRDKIMSILKGIS